MCYKEFENYTNFAVLQREMRASSCFKQILTNVLSFVLFSDDVFSVNETSGTVWLNAALDRENVSFYTFYVQVCSGRVLQDAGAPRLSNKKALLEKKEK